MTEESITPEEQEKQVFKKIPNENDLKKRSQLIEFYKVIVENKEQTEQRELLKQQKIFSNRMIVRVFPIRERGILF